MPGGALRLVALTKSFDDVVAVDGIDLDVPGGEFCSLLGASGCGKTTMLRMIAGLRAARRGRSARRRRLPRPPPHMRAVNTVFQNYVLFPLMTVATTSAFGLRVQDVDKAEATGAVGEALRWPDPRAWTAHAQRQLRAASSSGSRWPGR